MAQVRKKVTNGTGEAPAPRSRKKKTVAVVGQALSEAMDAQAGKAPALFQPSRDQVAQRAFEIFLARGATHGGDLDDWLRAERELSSSAA